MKRISLDNIIEIIHSKRDPPSVFLGAGCSRNSGVPLGGEIIKILEFLIVEEQKLKRKKEKSIFWKSETCVIEKILEQYQNDKIINKYKTEFIEALKQENEDYIRKTLSKNEHLLAEMPSILAKKANSLNENEWNEIIADSWYGFLFHKYLNGNKVLQSDFFAKLLYKKNPSLGYLHFALLMRYACFKSVITTNFDKLTEETFDSYGLEEYNLINSRTLIENNEAFETRYLPKENKPLFIYKIHGGFFSIDLKNSFEDINFAENKIYNVIDEENTIIIFGFSGADFRIMNRIQTFLRNSSKKIIWINRDSDINTLHKNVKSFLDIDNFYYFSLNENELDFDSFWAKIAIGILPTSTLNEQVAKYKLSSVGNCIKKQKKFSYKKNESYFNELSEKELINFYNNLENYLGSNKIGNETVSLVCYHLEKLHISNLKKHDQFTITDGYNFYIYWGNHLKKAGYFIDAVAKYEIALKKAETNFQICESKDNIASCLIFLGNFHKTNQLYLEINSILDYEINRNEKWYFQKMANEYNQAYLYRCLGFFSQSLRYNNLAKYTYAEIKNNRNINFKKFQDLYSKQNFNELYFLTNEAFILGQIGNKTQATEIYKKILADSDDNLKDEVAYSNYAYCLADEGFIGKSVEIFYKAFKLSALDTNILIGLVHNLKLIDNEFGEKIKYEIKSLADKLYKMCKESIDSLDEIQIISFLNYFNIVNFDDYHTDIVESLKKMRPDISYQKIEFSYVGNKKVNLDFYTKATSDFLGHMVLIK